MQGKIPMLRLRTWLRRRRQAASPGPREAYCYLGDGRAVTCTRHGRPILLWTRDLGIAPHIALTGAWEPDVERVLHRLLRPGQRVVEVGANMGYHSLTLAERIGPTGQLHCFEPHPELLPLLRGTMALNGFRPPRVTVHGVAALDRAGDVAFRWDPLQIGSGHVAEGDDGAEYVRVAEVPAVRLDDLLGPLLPGLDLLRMDAEGSELLVLRGAEALIRRSPGLRILMEWSPVMLATRGDPAEGAAWLAELGFRFWRLAGPAAELAPVPAEAVAALPHCELLLARGEPV